MWRLWRQRRINIRFDGPTLAQIEEIERLTGMGILTILEECVHLTNFLLKERIRGAQVMLQGPESDPALREVEFTP